MSLRERRRHRLRLSGVLVLVAALLSACSGIGSDTTVQPGLEVRGGDVQPVRAFFPGPARGATQRDIVLGFVRAGAASDGNFDTARSFLTQDGEKGWNPEGEVVLYSATTPLNVTNRTPDVAVLSGPVEASIGTDGRYVNAAGGATRRLEFQFARIDGQWRISNVPKGFGRWITTSDLGRLLQPYSLHYLASDRRALVPDRRWFPPDHLATRLARAQLSDPPAYLGDAVRNDIPRGSRLTADSVSVTDGVARVDITGRVPTDKTQRENVWAQLVSTLLQDPMVQGVTIRVRDVTLELPDVDLPVRTIEQVGFPAPPVVPLGRPLIRRGETLYLLPSTSFIDKDPQESGNVDIVEDFHSLALSVDGSDIAAVDQDGSGLSRFRGENRYEVPFFGTKVGHPAYDTRNFLWVGGIGLDEDSAKRLWAHSVAGDPAAQRLPAGVAVAADWLSKRRVVESKPSPSGDRVAILHTAENGTDAQVAVSGVARGAGGQPVRLATPLRLGWHLLRPTGLVWLSNTSVATLAQRAGTTEKRRPYVLSIDGQAQALGETPRGISITSAGGERDILVSNSDGTVISRAGQQWLSLGPGTDVLVPTR
ncbi:LpqB family beta-propeller domain-containing protein [Knoellia locipacati]|uniref:GerMN domain-containing protein n=1 Tax=Knoellia locipacati TaxID=882824 RepID=UPI00384EDB53